MVGTVGYFLWGLYEMYFYFCPFQIPGLQTKEPKNQVISMHNIIYVAAVKGISHLALQVFPLPYHHIVQITLAVPNLSHYLRYKENQMWTGDIVFTNLNETILKYAKTLLKYSLYIFRYVQLKYLGSKGI